MGEVRSLSLDTAEKELKNYIKKLSDERILSKIIIDLLRKKYNKENNPQELKKRLNEKRKKFKQEEKELKEQIKISKKYLEKNKEKEQEWLKDTVRVLDKKPEFLKRRLELYNKNFKKDVGVINFQKKLDKIKEEMKDDRKK